MGVGSVRLLSAFSGYGMCKTTEYVACICNNKIVVHDVDDSMSEGVCRVGKLKLAVGCVIASSSWLGSWGFIGSQVIGF